MRFYNLGVEQYTIKLKENYKHVHFDLLLGIGIVVSSRK